MASGVIAALLPCASAQAGPCPGGGPCVLVEVVGTVQTTKVFTSADLHRLTDLADPPYETRSDPTHQPSNNPNPHEATSLQSLVQDIDVPGSPGTKLATAAVTYTEVFDPAGASHRLSAGYLGPSHYQRALLPAVYASTGAIVYIRPLRNDDAGDVNVSPDPNRGGYFQTGEGGALRLTLHTSGRSLPVSISATPAKPDVGESVALSATIGADVPGATYAWDFADGTRSSSEAPSHRWTATGTYQVGLTVQGSDGSSGYGTTTVSVQPVTRSTPKPSPGTGGSTNTHDPVTGANQTKGHLKGGQVGSTSTGPTISGDTGRSELPSTTAATPSAKPTDAGGRRKKREPASGGAKVVGTLLLAAATTPGTPSTAAARASAAPARAASEPRRVTWLVLPGLLVVLLGIGGLSESPLGQRMRRRLSPILGPRPGKRLLR